MSHLSPMLLAARALRYLLRRLLLAPAAAPVAAAAQCPPVNPDLYVDAAGRLVRRIWNADDGPPIVGEVERPSGRHLLIRQFS